MSEIKQYYIDTVQRAYQTENGKSRSIDRIEQEFDRWLNEVKREAWKEGAIWHDRKKVHTYRGPSYPYSGYTGNPYADGYEE